MEKVTSVVSLQINHWKKSIRLVRVINGMLYILQELKRKSSEENNIADDEKIKRLKTFVSNLDLLNSFNSVDEIFCEMYKIIFGSKPDEDLKESDVLYLMEKTKNVQHERNLYVNALKDTVNWGTQKINALLLIYLEKIVWKQIIEYSIDQKLLGSTNEPIEIQFEYGFDERIYPYLSKKTDRLRKLVVDFNKWLNYNLIVVIDDYASLKRSSDGKVKIFMTLEDY